MRRHDSGGCDSLNLLIKLKFKNKITRSFILNKVKSRKFYLLKNYIFDYTNKKSSSE